MDAYADGTPISNSDQWMNWSQMPWDQGGLGLNKAQAAGLVGNLVNESGGGLNPWGPTGDNGSAWGTAQWRGDRLAALKSQFPDSYQTIPAQQQFMRQEFAGPEADAYKALTSAQNPSDAADAVNHLYERSADTTNHRALAAQALFNGQDPVAAINAAAGTTPQGNGALSFAGGNPQAADDDEDSGALNTNNVVGKGALQTIMPGEDTSPKSRIAQALVGMGASLASINSPGQASALNQVLAGMRQNDASKFKTVIGKDGTIYRVGTDDGSVKAFTPNGAAQGALPGDPSKVGTDYISTLSPNDQATLNGWHEGTGIMPNAYQLAHDPHLMQLQAAAMHAWPDMDFTRLPERRQMATDLARTGASSNGGIITNSNGAIQNLNNLADQYIKLGNSNGFGPAMVSHGINALKNWQGGTDRNSIIQGMNTNADDASGEITKVLTGGPGGMHERQARKARLGNSDYAPNEAAGVLEAEANDLLGKHQMVVSHIRNTMGQSYIDRHPEIEGNFKQQYATLTDKIAQLRSAGAGTPPIPQSNIQAQPGKAYVWTPQGLQEKQ